MQLALWKWFFPIETVVHANFPTQSHLSVYISGDEIWKCELMPLYLGVGTGSYCIAIWDDKWINQPFLVCLFIGHFTVIHTLALSILIDVVEGGGLYSYNLLVASVIGNSIPTQEFSKTNVYANCNHLLMIISVCFSVFSRENDPCLCLWDSEERPAKLPTHDKWCSWDSQIWGQRTHGGEISPGDCRKI